MEYRTFSALPVGLFLSMRRCLLFSVGAVGVLVVSMYLEGCPNIITRFSGVLLRLLVLNPFRQSSDSLTRQDIRLLIYSELVRNT